MSQERQSWITSLMQLPETQSSGLPSSDLLTAASVSDLLEGELISVEVRRC